MTDTTEMIQARIEVLQGELRQAETIRAQAAQTVIGLNGAINELGRLLVEISELEAIGSNDVPLPAEVSADKIWQPSSVID
jgi:hypothetical protein